MQKWRCGWCLACGILLMTGCESSTTPNAPQAAAPVVAPPPTDAAATVTAFVTAMKDGKVEHAYDLLPASYQKDVDGVVHEFASQMDSEIWSAGFGVLSKSAGVLKAKKDLLISMAAQPGRETQNEKMAQHWDSLVTGLERLTASDLSEIEKVKTNSTRDLLQKGVGPLAKAVVSMATVRTQDGTATAADLDQIKAEMVESGDTTAKVKVTSPGKKEPEVVEFTKVEGKWIPKSMADKWAENMTKTREQIQAIDQDAIAAQKPKILQLATTANGVLDEMMKAETPEQIQQAAFPLLLQGMMMGNQMGAPKPKTTKPAAGQVTITIAQDLSDADQEKFEVVLKGLVEDSGNRTITTTKVDGKTIVTAGPVVDVGDFAKKLTVAKELEIDAENRAITVERIEFE
ncbi:MAG TPA: hypothetical protein VFG20_18540 [Planctomycetaceae bacterium]|nr:hypothetical protein [Planctomycetaceae bacterium]